MHGARVSHDDVDEERPPEITRSQFDRVTLYISRLQWIPLADVNRGTKGPTRPDGTHPWITADYHPTVTELIEALEDNGFVDPNLDWIGWEDRADKLLDSDKLLRCASLEMCINLLTVHVRRDAMCVGYFGTMVGCGHVRLILLRLAELRQGAPESPDGRRLPARHWFGR